MILLIATILWPAFSSSQSPEILNQARKEGEVILYTTMTVRDFEFFNKAARGKYPFLNIRHVYLSSGRQVARVMQEFRAGRVQADVLGNSPDPLRYFKQHGVTGPYRFPESKNLLQGAWDPDGYWTGITTDLLLTGFNPRMISRAVAPRNYDENLKPQFKSQMAINRGIPYPLTGQV